MIVMFSSSKSIFNNSKSTTFPIKDLYSNTCADILNIEGGDAANLLHPHALWLNLAMILDTPLIDHVLWSDIKKGGYTLKESSINTYNEKRVNLAVLLILHYYIKQLKNKNLEKALFLVHVHRETSALPTIENIIKLLKSVYQEEISITQDDQGYPQINFNNTSLLICFRKGYEANAKDIIYQQADILFSYSLVAGINPLYEASALMMPKTVIPFDITDYQVHKDHQYSVKNQLITDLPSILAQPQQLFIDIINQHCNSENLQKTHEATLLTAEHFHSATLLQANGLFIPKDPYKTCIISNENKSSSTAINPIWTSSMIVQLWKAGNKYTAIDCIQNDYQTKNFSFSFFGKKIFYLETSDEVKAVLTSQTQLGHVYHHFAYAADLKYDFVANNTYNSSAYKLDNQLINIWKLIHESFSLAMKNDKQHIAYLIDKHLHSVFLSKKTFELDKHFDKFFYAFWSEYLLGPDILVHKYEQLKNILLAAMKTSFYQNEFKSVDFTGLSSKFFSYAVRDQLMLGKETIRKWINKASENSFIMKFKMALLQINHKENLNINDQTIQQIVEDNVFDLLFEPDFLQNVMYEALVHAIKENIDFRDAKACNNAYAQGLEKGYLFPIRTRLIEKSITLPDSTQIPEGSMVLLNLKRAKHYHSAGARRCVGQAYTYYFKEHFFNCLHGIQFNIKSITQPAHRLHLANDENVPISPERYQVSWNLKRDEAMRHLPSHYYKNNQFFNVLGLHANAHLNAHITKQLTLKINTYLEKNNISLNDTVIVTAEVRGIPAASQVASHLQLPIYIIRKKGNYKMSPDEVYSQKFSKGYGDPDEVELPKEVVKTLAGKKIIFIDDGLASGQSALACIRLLEDKCIENADAAQVVLVLTLLKHDYVITDPALSAHCKVKTLFDSTTETKVTEKSMKL